MNRYIIAILIALVVSGAGFYFYQKTGPRTLKNEQPLVQNQPIYSKLEEVSDLGVFKQDQVIYDENENLDEKVKNPVIVKAKYKYFKYGVVPSGTYKDNQIYLVETNTFQLAGNTSSRKIYFLIATKDNKNYTVYYNNPKEAAEADLNELKDRFVDLKLTKIDSFPFQFPTPETIAEGKVFGLKRTECYSDYQNCAFELTQNLIENKNFTKITTINNFNIYIYNDIENKNEKILADVNGLLFQYSISIFGNTGFASTKASDLGLSNSKYKEYRLLTPACSFDTPNNIAKDFGDGIVNLDNLNKINSLSEIEVYSLKDLNSSVNKKLVDQIFTQSYVNGRNGGKANISDISNNGLLIIKDQLGIYRALVQTDLTWGGCGKPVVYLYPEKETKVTIKFENEIKFDHVIPNYIKSWKVMAYPNGTLQDLQPKLTNCKSLENTFGLEYAKESCDKNSYPYLYWSGRTQGSNYPEASEGFIVNKKDLNAFFDEKLILIGLNQKEINDFKQYWTPTLANKNCEYFRITFFQNDLVNKMFPMNVHPQPNSSIRVFMDWDYATKETTIAEQKLNSYPRKGFTLVEWGGLKK